MGFLGLAAPLFLLSAAWPVVARALDLDDADRDGLLDQLIRTTIASGRSEVGSSFFESA
jgi:hypothetical protein